MVDIGRRSIGFFLWCTVTYLQFWFRLVLACKVRGIDETALVTIGGHGHWSITSEVPLSRY